MSLSWTFSDNAARLAAFPANEDGSMHPVSWAIIMSTMNTGMGTITADNAGEFFARLSYLDAMHGPFVHEPNNDATGHRPHRFTPADVKAHIGLSTNVRTETRAAWVKRFVMYDLDENVARFNRS